MLIRSEWFRTASLLVFSSLGLLAPLPWPASAAARSAEDDLARLTEDLRSADEAKAVRAAEELAKRGEGARAAVPALVQALQRKEVTVRAAAVHTLGSLGPVAQEAVPALIELFEDTAFAGETQVWMLASQAVGKMGAAAVEPLLPCLDPARGRVYAAAGSALHDIGPAAAKALPQLIQRVETNDDQLIPALFALQGIGPAAKDALPALIRALDHPDFHTQYWTCRALGALGDEAQPAVAKLIERLQNGVTSVRRNAAIALGNIGAAGGDAALDALIAALQDPLQPVRVEAVIALGKFGPAARSAVPQIQKLVQQPGVPGRARAAGALWRIDPTQRQVAVEALFADLQGDEAPWDAAQELGDLAPRAGLVERVAGLLKSDNPSVRESAADALGWMGKAAVGYRPQLQQLADQAAEEPDVRTAAREALARIDEKEDETEAPGRPN